MEPLKTSRDFHPPQWWPRSDRVAWTKAYRSADIFDEHSPAGRWSERTWHTAATEYTYWLRYLATRKALDEDVPPTNRVTPDAVSGFSEHLTGRVKTTTRYTYVTRLYKVCLVLAPREDWKWLREMVADLWRAIEPPRKPRPIVPVDQLYALGFKLMTEAEQSQQLRYIKRAVLYRDGLMVAFLAARPLRLGNFARIRLGYHLTKTWNIWLLHIPAAETKGRRPIEVRLPVDLNAPLERFLDAYRPAFLAASSYDFLWPSWLGRPLSYTRVHQVIVERTKAEFGFRVNPNHFRACAATTMAIRDPVHVRDVSQILGHVRLGTLERFYNLAQTVDASRRYQDHLDALRARLGCGS